MCQVVVRPQATTERGPSKIAMSNVDPRVMRYLQVRLVLFVHVDRCQHKEYWSSGDVQQVCSFQQIRVCVIFQIVVCFDLI
jgi:hypothetical protein